MQEVIEPMRNPTDVAFAANPDTRFIDRAMGMIFLARSNRRTERCGTERCGTVRFAIWLMLLEISFIITFAIDVF